MGKKKKSGGESSTKISRSADPSPSLKVVDNDMEVFISMAQELKDEGNKLFQKRGHEGAILKYEKAIKLLPKRHIDVAYLRSNMAACYMQMGVGEYATAISECNLALEVCPKYSKALLKRAKCYEAVNKLDSAYKDVDLVLNVEPNNVTALEIADRVKKALEKKVIMVDDNGFSISREYVEIPRVTTPHKVLKEKKKKKKNNKNVERKKAKDKVVVEENQDKLTIEENQNKLVLEDNQDKLVVEENLVAIDEPQKSVKLVFGEDIRWAQVPANCDFHQLMDTVRNSYSILSNFLIKYKDQAGDLVTITSTEELRLAEAAGEPQGSVRLYVVEQEPLFEGLQNGVRVPNANIDQNGIYTNGKSRETEKRSTCIEEWIIQFARAFKNHVGFDTDSYLDLHELGMKLYSEAMEDTVSSEEAQELFDIAAEKFQEMAALALFNWGNVHMSKARKKVFSPEDASRETILMQIKAAYEWAQKEYIMAGVRYETTVKIKPGFYEALLALGQQQFEQARLSWYHAVASKVDLETWPSTEVLQLYNNAEDNMEKGTQTWEEMEEQRLNGLSKPDKTRIQLQKMGLSGLFKDVSQDKANEQAANMRSQINLLWGTILYELSIVEFKLGLSVWEECLEVAVEKFELAGACPTDIAVMIKNHCANRTAFEGLGFKTDEIVQAWNEMYDAKRWKSGIPSFRLEPLFRRRVPNLHEVLELV